jgi:hypothetical protein
MKKISALLVVFAMLAVPLTAGAQTTTNTAFQVANLNETDTANISVVFYDTSGTEVYTMDDTIPGGQSKIYVQASMTDLGTTFNGSVVISSDQEVAAVVNQNTTGDSRYNAAYTGFSEGSDTFYLPVILNGFYGWHTEVSVQNAGASAVDVTITYSTAGCTDSATGLAMGAAVRFDNMATCAGGLDANGSATISASGPVVAVVNQITPSDEKEQTYNGFAPADGADTLYNPIALKDYFTFNSSFQVQNISGATMDITAEYSDGVSVTKTGIADGDAATFLQATEAHASNWTGSAMISNSTGGDMVAIVNQASSGGKASSFNMFSASSTKWALPSLLYDFYGYNSAFQVQNVSGSAADISVTYSDGTTASASGVADNDVASFIQATETHASGWSGSAIVEATGGVVVVVNQDAPADFDKQYSYNAVPAD